MVDFINLVLPFAYRAKYYPPRKAKFDIATLRDHVLVQVPSVASEEAPVALRAWSDDHEQQELVYRDFGGKLYVPLGLSETPVSLEDVRRTWAPDAVGLHGDWHAQHFPELDYRNGRHPMLYERRHQFEERQVLQARGGRVRWADDNLDGARGEAAVQFSQGLLVVDGEMWTSIGVLEPFWHIISVVRGPERSQWRMILKCPVEGRTAFGIHNYAVHRAADGKALAKSLGRALKVVGRVEIAPGFVSRRDDVVDCALGMLERLRLAGCEDLDRDAHLALAELSAIGNAMRSGETDRDTAERAFALAKAIVDSGAREFLDYGGAVLESALQRIEREIVVAPAIPRGDEDAIAGLGGP